MWDFSFSVLGHGIITLNLIPRVYSAFKMAAHESGVDPGNEVECISITMIPLVRATTRAEALSVVGGGGEIRFRILWEIELCRLQVKKSEDEEEEQMRYLNVSKGTFHFSRNNQI